MITAFRCAPGGPPGAPLDPAELRDRAAELRASPDVIWVDLDAPTPEEEDLVLADFLPVHPLTREDITRLRRDPGGPPHFPKVEEFDDYLFVIVNPLVPGYAKALGAGAEGHGRATTQLSAVLTERLLVTHHYAP